MTRNLFGTDGIRGKANVAPITADVALQLGVAAGKYFTRGDHRHRVVIGKDTRLSGYMLEPALTAGFVSVGMDVVLVGPMPTPAVAILTRSLRADIGVMISASHNPYYDNGIKIFGPDGFKLSDDVEVAIEGLMANGAGQKLAESADLGRVQRLDDAQGRYIEYAKNTFPKGLSLKGLKIVVDCAHGAAYKVAPTVLWELGAELVPLGVNPNGFNINDGCGSTSPENLCTQVRAHNADLGIALDGDADRLLVADENGEVMDGDQLMAVIAEYWQRLGQLKGGGVVATVMSNLGLERYLRSLDLDLIRTSVGDRYVVEKMRSGGFNLGGEQSGHIILSDFITTGDGLITALQLLAVVLCAGRPASEIFRRFEPFPQILQNVRFSGPCPLDQGQIQEVIAAEQRRLGNAGRLVIRKSGTEPLIRVMAEGEDEALINEVVQEIVQVLDRAAQ